VPATDLFTNADFASYLHEDVDNSSTVVCRRLASGWLRSSTGLPDWVAPVDDQLFGWALELAAIAYRNPDGLASASVDDYAQQWDRSRRKQILDAARDAFGTGNLPQYDFPDADWHWTVVPFVNPIVF
jgi:hypothetical protein